MSGLLSRWRLHAMWTTFVCLLIGGGVLALSESDCGGETITLQAVDTPHVLSFPSDRFEYYPSNCEREWRINTTYGYVKLVIFELDMEGTLDVRCAYDYLRFYHEYSAGRYVIAELCGQLGSNNRTITSTSKSVSLHFKSDGSREGHGFQLAYKRIPESYCEGGTTTLHAVDTPRILSFPSDGSEHYPHDCQQEWRITTTYGTIELEIFELEVEGTLGSSTCSADYLRIYDEFSSNTFELAVLCGSLRFENRTINSTTDSILLRFNSDTSIQRNGFQLAYKRRQKTVTSLTAYDFDNSLTYPLIGNYPNSADRQWRIVSSNPNRVVKVVFESLDVEEGSECHFDAVTFYDGFNMHAEEMEKFCGQLDSSHRTVRSTSEYLFLQFTSDTSVTRSGFKIRYKMEDPDSAFCNQDSVIELTATDISGELKSPNFPRDYPSDCQIEWRIYSDRTRVQFTVQTLDMEYASTSNCYGDVLTFYDGYDDYANIFKELCGQSYYGIKPFYSSSDYVYIKFRSDSSVQHSGFQIYFQATDKTEEKKSNVAGLIGGIFGGIVFLTLSFALVAIYTRAKKRRQPPQQRPSPAVTSSAPLPNPVTTNPTYGSVPPSVYYISTSAPPPAYDTLNHAYVHDESPPSYSEAKLYITNPNAEFQNPNAAMANVPAGQMNPATPPGVVVMPTIKENNTHVYANQPEAEASRRSEETGLFQTQSSIQLQQPNTEQGTDQGREH